MNGVIKSQTSPAILEQRVENLKLELRNERRDHQATRDRLALRESRIILVEREMEKRGERIGELEKRVKELEGLNLRTSESADAIIAELEAKA